MMNTRLLNSLPFAIPVSILTFAVFLVTYSSIQLDDTLAMGIIYDLTLTSPILYLIAIWRTKTPKITTVPVFILGIAKLWVDSRWGEAGLSACRAPCAPRTWGQNIKVLHLY